MKVYKFLPPYDKNGKCTFKKSLNRSGVYLIKEDGKLVYVGYSGKNLYKTLYRHFESWRHPYQEVTTYATELKRRKYTVRIVYCTAQQAAALEKKLILKYNPRDNAIKYKNYMEETSTIGKNYADKTYNNYKETEVEEELPF